MTSGKSEPEVKLAGPMITELRITTENFYPIRVEMFRQNQMFRDQHIARREIEETGEAGGGMATAGLILGYVALAIVIILILAFIAIINLLRGFT